MLVQCVLWFLCWLGILLVLGLLCMLFLVLLLVFYLLVVLSWLLMLSGKIFCYVIVVVVLDLVWGYVGMLLLGYGIFFVFGGYVMGMYLMCQVVGDGLLVFMFFFFWSELFWFWWGMQYFVWVMVLVVLVFGLLVLVFGWFVFCLKIKGVYFLIMIQVLIYVGMLLFFCNEIGFGGNNGFIGFIMLLGFLVIVIGICVSLFMVMVLLLLLMLWLGVVLVQSKFGWIFIVVCDVENWLMFCGYDLCGFKLLVWMLLVVFCGLVGVLYVLQVGIINFSEMLLINFIEVVIWVVFGGCGILIGLVFGVGLVNGVKSIFIVVMLEYWQLFFGFIFIIVILFLFCGVMGLLC